jgi:seryl-tRNA synthetase
MIDIKALRETPGVIKAGVARKKFECNIDAVLELDTVRREKIGEAEVERSKQKATNQEMAALQKGSPEFLEKVKEMKVIAGGVKALEAEAREADEAFQAALMSIPNIPDPSVPDGKDEEEAVTVASFGDIDKYEKAIPHFDISWFEQLVDFSRGVKVTGAGFPFYVGDMARLVRSLIQFFLDEAANAGYVEVSPPLVVNAASATATGALPDKEGQMYVDIKEGLYLIPTAEVPVTNYFRDEILNLENLPAKRVAYTPCFRREAGSWGAHVRGLNRLHQFDKVEIVQWTEPSKSLDALEEIRGHSESLLKKLDLPYRVQLMPAGDIGFPHSKQYDLEVWAGGQKRWLEVSSCSSFTDFQARRANIRFRRDEGGKPEFVHTLNGSALAIPRVLAAILENNLQEDGRVKVPAELTKWFGKEYLTGS